MEVSGIEVLSRNTEISSGQEGGGEQEWMKRRGGMEVARVSRNGVAQNWQRLSGI
jgi:hypothetical protein